MPELPEVETIRDALNQKLTGRRVKEVLVHNPHLRESVDAAALADHCVGRPFQAVRRRGKYLIVECGDGQGLIVHLGMTGSFRVGGDQDTLGRHDHVEWRFEDGLRLLFNDPRRFGCVMPIRLPLELGNGDGPLPRLGPEPLSDDFSVDFLYHQLHDRQAPVKNILMDQAVVAGMGNIYASEALFRAGISPRRKGSRISRRSCGLLRQAIRSVLKDAIVSGGTTISDYRSLDGLEGRFAVRLQVYGKAGQPCPKCGEKSLIRRVSLAGRSTFFCPGCQH